MTTILDVLEGLAGDGGGGEPPPLVGNPDLGGGLVTGGSGNAYTLTAGSFPAYAAGIALAFVADRANSGAATLNVNGKGAKAIRHVWPGGEVALVAGQIVAGGHYIVQYDEGLASGAGGWAILNPGLHKADVGLGSVDNTSDAAKPISTATQTALAAKAPLASPTFIGTPAAPTAAEGTNTTQLATTAFVRAEVASLVAAAPSALDTLDELAAALGDDANFAATMTAALAAKAPLASPALTGTPTAPTAAGGTNTTQLATTAFVRAEVASLVAAAPSALDTLDELAAALGDDANFAATMTAALAAKAPLASPALTGTPTAPTAAGGTNTTQVASTAFVHGALTDLFASPLAVASGGTGVSTLLALRTALGLPQTFGTVADDTATSKNFGVTAAGIGLLYPSSGTGPVAIFHFRAGTTPNVRLLASAGTVNVTTGVLAGTTGSDGALTISAHTDFTVYIENRSGASLVLACAWITANA